MKNMKKSILGAAILGIFSFGCNKDNVDSDKSTIEFTINNKEWKCNDGVAAITKVYDDLYTITLKGKVKDYFETKDSDFLLIIERESAVSKGTYNGTDDGAQVSVSYIDGFTYYGKIPAVSPDADFWITIDEIESSTSISNRIKGTFGGTLKRNVGTEIITKPISNGKFYWN